MAPVLINGGHIDVQELRKTNLEAIPDRFIKNKEELPFVAKVTAPSSEVPVIDLSKLANGSNEDIQLELLKLATACEEWGFFQVINHGIDLKLLESIETVSNDFFMLPLEEKQKYPMPLGQIQGYGQAFLFSEDQKLDWCNMLAVGVEPPSIRRPDLWPIANPPTFSETLEKYSKEVRSLCKWLLSLIAINLGLNKGTFEEMFGAAVQAVRMNYYPPCPKPDLVLGLSPHSDGSALTVLQQRKDSPVGLQIFKDNTWVSVQPAPNALVINIGDTLEVLTNGKYKSVEHRAVADKDKDRLTIVTFYAPSYEIELGPIKELVNENAPCKYKRFNHGEYSKHYVTNKLQGKKTLEFAKIAD